ncbi:MAG: ABC transporter permease subunit [Desulfobacteraceae bacterium]|jgi:ABC-type transport system involved in multi-copper enzyme maturation permease subunit
MLGTLIEKELKSILLSPKFAAVFSVCSILIILSFFLGIEDYKTAMSQYEAVVSNNNQQLKETTSWESLGTVVGRRPDPMQIFVTGIAHDMGRQAPMSRTIKLYNSHYSENTIFAVFRSMDLMFIVQIVLSLFAILFTYDSICGEKESGTLKLSFANQVPRAKYIAAKILGSWTGLVIPLLIPVLLGVLLVILYDIPMTKSHWFRFSVLMGFSFLYFSFFLCLGIFMSSLTRRASASFLFLLVIWVCCVLIIPRTGVMLAGHFVKVPTATEIASKFLQKNREFVEEYRKESDKYMKESMEKMQSIIASNQSNREELEAKLKEHNDNTLLNIKKRGAKLSEKRSAYDSFLKEDWRNRKIVREKLGFSLSRFSPASAFQLAADNLAETGIDLKYKYEDQLRNYRDIFTKFRTEKHLKENSSYEAYKARMEGNVKPIDVSDVPQFEFASADISQLLQKSVVDMGILSFYILLAIAGSFIAFIRYDVR